MERTDLERKLSKRKSSSLWSRKSLRRSSTSQAPPQPSPAQLTSPSTSSLARPPPRSIADHESADIVPPMPIVLSRSLVPDRLPELPSWYRENSNSARYPIHNPVGPRWYQNHHLVPPANNRPSRPPSVFSPSFPPIASSGDPAPTPTRSGSNSPLPTPNSSQTDVQPRSRKTSQTARDNVDLLDASDPWGAPWHHESPYDVGLSSSPVSFEENGHSAPNAHTPTSVQAARSRSSSVATAQNRRKAVTPSPLSQSTSAIHLQVPETALISRKLSKRRTVGIFRGRHVASAPTSPADDTSSRASPASLRGPPSSFLAPTPKEEKRGSVLGRLAKRFSIIRKPAAVVAPMQVVRQPSPEKREPSPEKFHAPEPVKRVPPPLLHQDSSFVVIHPEPEPSKVEADRASSISLETELPYTMGRLTVANPDPGSVESTPVQREQPLPQEEQHVEQYERDRSIPASPSPSKSPIPIAMPEIQAPQPPARSLEPVASSSRMSVLSSRHSAEHRVNSRNASPPPPPAPEKPSKPTSEAHRQERPSSSGPRTSLERSTSPPSNGAPPSRGRVQSPPNGKPARPQSQSPTKPNGKPSLDKPQPPPPPQSPLSPKLPAVPFPPNFEPTPAPPPRELPHQLPEMMMTADISPLSVSSVLVNPPTPYTKDTPMLDEPEPELAPPPVPSKRSSRDPSPVSVTGRETETFRLVRSASGTVYASSETIRAAGEQWEVIESSKSKGKNRSQDQSWDGDSRREQRRQAKADKEAEGGEPRSRSERQKRRSTDGSGDRERERGHHHRAPIPEALVSRQDDPPNPKGNRSSKRDEERESRKAERKAVDVDKPQPPPPGSAPPLPARNPQRTPSKSARPTSEVPTAANMNQMKAREAWDMDRLWKARSMGGMEANGINIAAAAPIPAVPPVPVLPVANGNGNGRPAEEPQAVYGSSHTAFMVSTPFQQQQPQPPQSSSSSTTPIYHSMPPAPPSVVYPAGYASASPNGYSPSSTAAATPASTTRASPSSEHAFLAAISPSASSNALSPRAPLANPLPEPPRESPYEPAPLTRPDLYWGKHAAAGVTTAH
ncbi:hypothetical protein K438DRAFT_1954652 [Mycena galopus ATCC 62051]|nr:hypothetical protein K438DRAFT_1954652 [Mycena galopus ATCC 62051]